MSLAAVETRANASVIARMANASALAAGGGAFPVVFDNAFTPALGGQVSGTQPQLLAKDADLAANAVAVDAALTVSKVDASGGTVFQANYVVRDVQPDGTGLSVVTMERA